MPTIKSLKIKESLNEKAIFLFHSAEKSAESADNSQNNYNIRYFYILDKFCKKYLAKHS